MFQRTDTVLYIVNCSREGKRLDSLELIVTMFTDNSKVEMPNMALSSETTKTVSGQEILKIY